MRVHSLFFLLGLAISLPAQSATEVWVYSSVYKEFITPIATAFEKQNPDIKVQVFQGGSEKIQAKVESELMAQKPQADVIMVSDPFWPAQMAKRDLVEPRKSGAPYDISYYSLMVMIAHKDVPAAERPGKWSDLTDAKFAKKVQMGSPLESGTMFTTVAYLSQKYGWGYFEKLRKNGIASSGGNSAVIQKVESGERKLGIVLLENALAAQKRGSPIEIIYPADGGIPIPSVQLVTKSSPHKAEALKFSAFLLQAEGQTMLKAGYMYSADPNLAPPVGAKPFSEATKGATLWTPEAITKTSEQAKDIKKKFSEIVLD